MAPKLVIATSEFQAHVSDLLPSNKGLRSQLTHSLIKAFSLLEKFDLVITKPISSKSDLLEFHSSSYIEALLDEDLNKILPYDTTEDTFFQLNEYRTRWRATHVAEYAKFEPLFKAKDHLLQHFQDLSSTMELNRRKRSYWDSLNDLSQADIDKRKITDLRKYNLEGDCPLFSFLPLYCQVIAGASLMLANHITKSERTIAINWDGGRHHALKTKASGFCYINDIVLLIQRLRRNGFEKMTYIDFDLHHGDGVEKAFQFSSNIQTISLHMFEPGFFPCTGSLSDTRKGKNIVNIPLLHGLSDDYLGLIMNDILLPLISDHDPEVLIIQCGGDGLIGDGFNEWQLTIKGLSRSIVSLISRFKNCSVVLLGGGGYNPTVMSRFYTYLTWKVLTLWESKRSQFQFFESEEELIPEHEFIDFYLDEHFKFWSYEHEGSLRKKCLKNNNKIDNITKLQEFYNIKKTKPEDTNLG